LFLRLQTLQPIVLAMAPRFSPSRKALIFTIASIALYASVVYAEKTKDTTFPIDVTKPLTAAEVDAGLQVCANGGRKEYLNTHLE
jgi:hypothetical protein